jgi:hypothetical protein
MLLRAAPARHRAAFRYRPKLIKLAAVVGPLYEATILAPHPAFSAQLTRWLKTQGHHERFASDTNQSAYGQFPVCP